MACYSSRAVVVVSVVSLVGGEKTYALQTDSELSLVICPVLNIQCIGTN